MNIDKDNCLPEKLGVFNLLLLGIGNNLNEQLPE